MGLKQLLVMTDIKRVKPYMEKNVYSEGSINVKSIRLLTLIQTKRGVLFQI